MVATKACQPIDFVQAEQVDWSELTEFYRIAVWARNFRASRSVSIGKDLSSYGGASIVGAHHVRE